MSTTTTVPSARFGRRSTRGVILGFSAWRVAALSAAVIAFMFWLLLVGGAAGFGLGVLAAAGPAAVAFVRIGGLPAVEWTPVAFHWQARVVAGQTTFRAKPSRPRPAGTLALPGDAASLRFYIPDAQPVCMIHDPWRNTLSAILHVRHPAYVLLSPDDQAQRVSAWGRVQASLAQSGTCAGLQVMEAAIPDSGQGVRDWYDQHATARDGWAARQYETLLAATSVGASTHRSTLTLTLNLRTAASAVRSSGGGLAGAAKVLAGDMVALEYGLHQA
ncbi:MAG TPA: SCO6880 family protein, partial [Acidimicrobiales bacterium]|nr:SCO6880 family protein [Acidimicrobiales bacterium]